MRLLHRFFFWKMTQKCKFPGFVIHCSILRIVLYERLGNIHGGHQFLVKLDGGESAMPPVSRQLCALAAFLLGKCNSCCWECGNLSDVRADPRLWFRQGHAEARLARALHCCCGEAQTVQPSAVKLGQEQCPCGSSQALPGCCLPSTLSHSSAQQIPVCSGITTSKAGKQTMQDGK